MIHAIGTQIKGECNYLIYIVKNVIKEVIWYDLTVKNVPIHTRKSHFNRKACYPVTLYNYYEKLLPG